MKLKVLAFALACSILWGMLILLLACWVDVMNGPSSDLGVLRYVYIGYSTRPLGSIIGFLWGSFDGFIFGFFLSILYNFFSDILYRKKK
jgi:hypothetical protein